MQHWPALADVIPVRPRKVTTPRATDLTDLSFDLPTYKRGKILTCKQMPVGIEIGAVVSVLVKFFLFLFTFQLSCSLSYTVLHCVPPCYCIIVEGITNLL